MKERINSLKKSVFFRNAGILISGTALSQSIPLLISPVITRLYDPASFGVFAIYISVITILLTISTGRYEKAIVIPSEIETSKRLTVLSQSLIILFTAFLFVIVHFFGAPVLSILNIEGLIPFVYLIPIGVLLMASDQSAYHWANKIEKYKRMSFSKVASNLSSGTLQIVLGFFKLEALGLIAAKLTGLFVSYIILISTFKLSDFLSYKLNEIKSVAKRYILFPKYLMSAHLLNSIALNSPPIILAFYFNETEIGFFGLTQRAIMLPVSIVSRSVGDVFRQKAVDDLNKDGNCKKIYKQTFWGLLIAGIIPFLILLFLSPWLFKLVFGTEWETAGNYAQILAVLFLFQFVSAPFNNMFLIREKQKQELLWQVLFFISSTVSIFVGYYIFKTITGALIIFALSRSVSYLLGIFMTSKLTVKQ
ncbi:MAG: oligosaccharide flippase family protein [Chitinophagales bacterium]